MADKIQKIAAGIAAAAIGIHVLAGAWAVFLVLGLLVAAGAQVYKVYGANIKV